MNPPTTSKKKAAQAPTSIAVLIWLGLFAAVVALLGGSSRFDAIQATALRPLLALFLVPAFYRISKSEIGAMRVPLILLALLTLWMVLQLVPVPPSIWQSLPDRQTIANLDRMNELDGLWRSVSFVPMRGWNAVSSMIVPISAALLLISMKPKTSIIFVILIGFGVVDAVFGLIQIAGGSGATLYFYTPTNYGSPVGIFANENHSGALSAITLVIIARMALRGAKHKTAIGTQLVLGLAFLLVTLGALVSGSRAALGLTVAAYLAITVMAWLYMKQPDLAGPRAGRAAILVKRPMLSVGLGFVVVAALFALLFQFDRAAGVDAAFSQDAFVDLRWRIAPILADLISRHWLFGTGFGTFDAVYQMSEPANFLARAYVNQAHNDWAQWVIEGGLPAIAILAAFLIWVSRLLRSLFMRNPMALARCVFWLAILVFLSLASLVDYPLRTPAFQMLGIWLVIALAQDSKDHGGHSSAPSR